MPDTTTVNQQVVDAVAETAAAFAASGAHAQAGAEQLTALALGLAMQNAVAQQQQLYMLQNAANAALVKALLESGPDAGNRWAEALQLVREAFSVTDVNKTLAQLKDLLDQLRSARAAGPAPGAAPAGAAQE